MPIGIRGKRGYKAVRLAVHTTRSVCHQRLVQYAKRRLGLGARWLLIVNCLSGRKTRHFSLQLAFAVLVQVDRYIPGYIVFLPANNTSAVSMCLCTRV